MWHLGRVGVCLAVGLLGKSWRNVACKEALQKKQQASGVAQQHPQNRTVCRQAEIEPRNVTPLVGSLIPRSDGREPQFVGFSLCLGSCCYHSQGCTI